VVVLAVSCIWMLITPSSEAAVVRAEIVPSGVVPSGVVPEVAAASTSTQSLPVAGGDAFWDTAELTAPEASVKDD